MRSPFPTIWSKRFRQILRLALAGEPARAITGLYWFATRRRVRGWGQLLIAASEAEHGYVRWIADSEPRLIARYASHYPPAPLPAIIALVLDADGSSADAEHSIASLNAAFGPDVDVKCCSQAAHIAAALQDHADESVQWVLLLLAGDVVSSVAGDLIARAVAAHQQAPLIYWDEDRIERGCRSDPWIKPDWDEMLFGTLGGLVGASVVSLAELRRASPEGTDRAKLERLLHSIAAEAASQPAHIPLILTHRCDRTALTSPLPAAAEFQPSSTPAPKVSVIIPTRDRPDLIGPCLEKLADTDYPDLEVIVVDNGSVDPRALAILDKAAANGIRLIRDAGPFNFSRLNNQAAAIAAGEFLCFYNNDVEPIRRDWLLQMMRVAVQEGTGAVGALLLYPSGRIQHAGVAVGIGGAAGHIQKGVLPDDEKFRSWHAVTREVSAVTAAVMVVRKSAFDEVSGFDERAFPVAFNDVDLCLRLKEAGLRNYFVSEARLLHRESESRGDDRRPERAAQFAAELQALQARWHTEEFTDPFFSPLFLRSCERLVLEP